MSAPSMRRRKWTWLSWAGVLTILPALAAVDLADARLDRWVGGLGGRAALRAAPSLHVRGRVEIEGPQPVLVSYGLQMASDGRFRVELSRPDVGDWLEIFDGETGWRHSESLGGGMMLPGESKERVYWDDLYLALRYRDLFPRRTMLPDQQVDGRWYHAIDMQPREGPAEQWYLDFETGLLHARVRPAEGPVPPVTMILTEYRKVGDRLQLPARITTHTAGGRLVLHRHTVTVGAANTDEAFIMDADTREQAAAARRILDQHLAAIGGPEAAARIRSRIITGHLEDQIAGVRHSLQISQLSPHFVLRESEAPGLGRSLEGFDGTTAWAYSDVEGYRVLKGGALASLLGSASLLAETQLQERFPFAQLLPTALHEDRPAHRLQLASWSGPAGTYWFDQESGHLVRAEASMAAGAEGMVEVMLEFADFRAVDGVVMPFRITTRNPAVHTITTILEVQHDAEMDPAMFAPRKDG